MPPKIAILITTFLRDSLLYRTLQTIVDANTKDCIVLIADQGYHADEKDIQIDYYKSQLNLEYFQIPFDSGLSFARNFLVNRAKELNIPYVLMLADSIQFSDESIYDFTPIIAFLEEDPKRGLVGFELANSKCPWEYKFDVIIPDGIKFRYSDEIIKQNELEFLKVDICRNIFLAKTPTLIDLWDNEMKLGEHELAFVEYKRRGFEVYWTSAFIFKKNNSNGSEEYKEYRKRFQDYVKILKTKLNITGWVIYPKKPCK